MQMEVGKTYLMLDILFNVKVLDDRGYAWGLKCDGSADYVSPEKMKLWAEFIPPLDAGEGWRFLDDHEEVQVGDEFWQLVSGWRPVLVKSKRRFLCERYRRRTAPKYVPYEWEDRHGLFGRRFRFKDINLEKIITNCRLEHNVFYIDGVAEEAFLKSCEWIDGTPCGKVAN